VDHVSSLTEASTADKSAREYFQEGSEQMRAGEWQKAEASFRSAININGDNGYYHAALVFALANQQRWTGAVSEIKTWGKLDALSWLLSFQEHNTPNAIAFVRTDDFRRPEKGILAYLAAHKKGGKAEQKASEDVGVWLDKFSKERSFAMIFDESARKNLPVPIETGPAQDVSEEFIKYYNDRHPVK
jgi:hypothetical protein